MFQPQKKLNELLTIQTRGQDYLDQTLELLGSVALPDADVRVMCGEYESIEGLTLPEGGVTLLDIRIRPGRTFSIRADSGETIRLYLMEGGAKVEETLFEEYASASYTGKDSISITAQGAGHARLVYFCGKPSAAPEVLWPERVRERVAG